MAKFYGIIGYAISEETLIENDDGDEIGTGKWTDEVVERSYTGDVLKNIRGWQVSEKVNPDSTISDTISIIADGFTLANMHSMKYVKWRDACWAINSVRVERPRVIVEIGGLFSGQTHAATPDTP
jgi:hypothetical protein